MLAPVSGPPAPGSTAGPGPDHLDEACRSFSAFEGPAGVLVLHGLTATVATVRPIAEALADAGFAVEAPLLAGHGTTPEDLASTGFEEWYAAAERAYLSLSARSDVTLVAGHSMGGTLALQLALEHRDLAGLVLLNAFVEPPAPSFVEALEAALRAGRPMLPAVGGDIARAGVAEPAYDAMPAAALLSLSAAASRIAPRLGEISCPALVITSRRDHVVPASHGELLAASLAGPVERVVLERSFHVATLDHDAVEVESRAVAFAQKCCA